MLYISHLQHGMHRVMDSALRRKSYAPQRLHHARADGRDRDRRGAGARRLSQDQGCDPGDVRALGARAAGTYVATGRAAAIQRGCRGVVHFSASAGTVWVTVCPRMATTGSGTIDTVGAVGQLGTLYNVTLSETQDSVQFDPRGL